MNTSLILLREWKESQYEFWVPFIPGRYDVSSFGRVRSLRAVVSVKGGRFRSIIADPPRIRKPDISKHKGSGGYVRLSVEKKIVNGGPRTFLVHRLVAKAFVPNPKKLPGVNHLNGIKSDNRSDNLRWSTQKDNVRHSVANGLRKKGMWIRRAEYEYLWDRIKLLEEQLATERAENRRSERHFANMWLRSRQGGNTFPLQPEQQEAAPTQHFEPITQDIDPGELEALQAVGEAYGVSALEAENLLRAQRGLPLKSPVQ